MDLTGERGDEVLDDGQAETDSAGTAIGTAIDLKERNEDLVEIALRDAGAGVTYLDVHRRLGKLRRAGETQVDPELDEACARELEGVGDEVVDDLEQLDLVDQHLGFPGGRQVKARAQLDSLGRRCGAVQVDGDPTDF